MSSIKFYDPYFMSLSFVYYIGLLKSAIFHKFLLLIMIQMAEITNIESELCHPYRKYFISEHKLNVAFGQDISTN